MFYFYKNTKKKEKKYPAQGGFSDGTFFEDPEITQKVVTPQVVHAISTNEANNSNFVVKKVGYSELMSETLIQIRTVVHVALTPLERATWFDEYGDGIRGRIYDKWSICDGHAAKIPILPITEFTRPFVYTLYPVIYLG